mmetsp:Transcript_146292/g.467400  ORF Transcript_146292/g.467400 Transcript_146292/m.467400 type:complete len:329 (-) Transcript_146292:277-1263(-)
MHIRCEVCADSPHTHTNGLAIMSLNSGLRKNESEPTESITKSEGSAAKARVRAARASTDNMRQVAGLELGSCTISHCGNEDRRCDRHRDRAVAHGRRKDHHRIRRLRRCGGFVDLAQRKLDILPTELRAAIHPPRCRPHGALRIVQPRVVVALVVAVEVGGRERRGPVAVQNPPRRTARAVAIGIVIDVVLHVTGLVVGLAIGGEALQLEGQTIQVVLVVARTTQGKHLWCNCGLRCRGGCQRCGDACSARRDGGRGRGRAGRLHEDEELLNPLVVAIHCPRARLWRLRLDHGIEARIVLALAVAVQIGRPRHVRAVFVEDPSGGSVP